MTTKRLRFSSLLLAGLVLLLLAGLSASTEAWLECRAELRSVRLELRMQELALRDAQQQLAAQKLINEGQRKLLLNTKDLPNPSNTSN